MRYTTGVLGTYSRTVTEADIMGFAGISGDFNDAHVNEEYAKGTHFKHRIAHGMLTSAFITGALYATGLGRGAIYVYQNMKFTAPVYIGDTVTVTIDITSVDEVKNRVVFNSNVTNQDGKTVLIGEGCVMPSKD